jgi:long-chain fatty acid transport protein
VLALCAASPAFAAAWKLETQGGRALGSAYAGGAAFDGDASAVWFNPAGMLLLHSTTVTAGLPVVDLTIDYHDSGASTGPGGLPLSGPRTRDAGTIVPVPHLYAVWPVNGRIAAGLGFNTPFGLGTDYGNDWVGRYQAVRTQLVVYNLNPSVAFALTDQLSLGAGIDLQYVTGRLSTVIDFGAIGASVGLPLQPQQHDGLVEIRGHDTNIGWNGGLLWHPSDRTRVGIAYRSDTTADLRGPARFDVPPEAMLLTAGGAFVNTRAHTALPMPESWSFGFHQQIAPRLALVGDATRTNWSRQRALAVTFDNPAQPPIVEATDWRNAWRYSLGTELQWNNRLTLRAGAADEHTPVPDATREPRIPEADHLWYAAGATWSWSKRVDLDFFIVHLTTSAAPIDVSSPAAGNLRGDARWNIWTVGAGATLRY